MSDAKLDLLLKDLLLRRTPISSRLERKSAYQFAVVVKRHPSLNRPSHSRLTSPGGPVFSNSKTHYLELRHSTHQQQPRPEYP